MGEYVGFVDVLKSCVRTMNRTKLTGNRNKAPSKKSFIAQCGTCRTKLSEFESSGIIKKIIEEYLLKEMFEVAGYPNDANLYYTITKNNNAKYKQTLYYLIKFFQYLEQNKRSLNQSFELEDLMNEIEGTIEENNKYHYEEYGNSDEELVEIKENVDSFAEESSFSDSEMITEVSNQSSSDTSHQTQEISEIHDSSTVVSDSSSLNLGEEHLGSVIDSIKEEMISLKRKLEELKLDRDEKILKLKEDNARLERELIEVRKLKK